jgi:hypothetical protein
MASELTHEDLEKQTEILEEILVQLKSIRRYGINQRKA